ncbi:MAG: amidohydrolase [Firmicutes bacterium]|nr:amidohydrolase [Bacillota bacterium]
MIFDAHNHIGFRKGLEYPVEKLIGEMDAANIDRAVVFSFPEQIDNDYVAESVKRFSDRLVGFAQVNPWSQDAELVLKRCVEDLGLKGLKLHPVRHGYAFDNHTILDPIFSLCERYSIPVLAYGGANVLSSPNMFEEMAQTFPSVNFILAHGGQMYETRSAIGVAKRRPNVYIETSAMFANRVESLYKEVGPEKIVMGTDKPYGDFAIELEKIQLVIAEPEVRERITCHNLRKLLGEKVMNYDY